MRFTLVAAALAALAAPAYGQSTTAAGSATSAAPAPTTTAAPAADGNGFKMWPMELSQVQQTTDCQRYAVFVPKGQQLESTVCFLDSYAFSWVWVREESTKGDTIPANVTADTRKCLPPNADKLYKTDVQGRAYVPKNPGDSATKRRCYTEHFPWGKSCLSYDAMVYMYISLKWPNDTVDQGVNGVVPMGNEYFKVPQTITIGNSSLIECGSWSTAPTPTGTAAATTSKPNSAGRVDMFFSAVVLAISVILAALSA